MSGNDTNATMFELAIQIENFQQSLYKQISRMFSHLTDVSDFWRGMEKDEKYHARTLENIRASLHPDQLLTPVDPSILRRTKRVLETPVQERIKSIDTLEDAYILSHELENSEINMIFEFLVKEFESSEETKKFALAEIEKHLEKLMNFPQTFGDIDWRKGIKSGTAKAH